MTSKEYAKFSSEDDQYPTPETLSGHNESHGEPGEEVNLNINLGDDEKGEGLETTQKKMEDGDDGGGEKGGGGDGDGSGDKDENQDQADTGKL